MILIKKSYVNNIFLIISHNANLTNLKSIIKKNYYKKKVYSPENKKILYYFYILIKKNFNFS